ncbi:MAG: hypothetical protein LC750_17675, partial [Actinobacteria bacterium]|nr:hypothetical protein [Actinomycetota bacterium]
MADDSREGWRVDSERRTRESLKVFAQFRRRAWWLALVIDVIAVGSLTAISQTWLLWFLIGIPGYLVFVVTIRAVSSWMERD